ncbi:MAG TPA: hypothetical protein VIG72_04695 [Pontibacter sp.]
MKHKTYALINSLNSERKKNLRFKLFKIIRKLNVWKSVEQEEKGPKKNKGVSLTGKKNQEPK